LVGRRVAAELPRQERFPSPAPLSEQEQALLSLVAESQPQVLLAFLMEHQPREDVRIEPLRVPPLISEEAAPQSLDSEK